MFTALGFISLGVGMAGIVVPVVPTVGPIIMSGYFFAKGSARFESWLLRHPRFGPIVVDWRSRAGFTARAKRGAVVAITLSMALSTWIMVWRLSHWWPIPMMTGIWVWATWAVGHQKTKAPSG